MKYFKFYKKLITELLKLGEQISKNLYFLPKYTNNANQMAIRSQVRLQNYFYLSLRYSFCSLSCEYIFLKINFIVKSHFLQMSLSLQFCCKESSSEIIIIASTSK